MGMKPIWARVVLGWVTSWEVLVKGCPMGMKPIWARVVLGWVTSWEVLVKGFHI